MRDLRSLGGGRAGVGHAGDRGWWLGRRQTGAEARTGATREWAMAALGGNACRPLDLDAPGPN